MGFKASVNPDMCISTGNCVRRAPQTFVFNEDDVAVAQEGTGLSDEELVQIARGCPVGAITLVGADGEEFDIYA